MALFPLLSPPVRTLSGKTAGKLKPEDPSPFTERYLVGEVPLGALRQPVESPEYRALGRA